MGHRMAGSAPTNNSAVDFEKEQAAEADAIEKQRQANLQAGQAAIDAIFEPQPVMQTTQSPFDWSTFTQPAAGSRATQPTGVPAGYTAVQIPGTPAAATTGRGAAPTSASGVRLATTSAGLPQGTAAPASSGAGSTWGLKDASGKVYNPGDPLSVSSQTPTGQKTGGFGDDFYGAYQQNVLDYYNPDEQRQYDQAQRDLTYNLARAGTLTSSVAADKTGDLAYQDAINKANIVSNANAQTGALRDQINANKQSLITQLYNTEDPTLTANLAEESAHASQLQDPTLTPAAGLFNTALTTAGSAYNAYNNAFQPVPLGYTGGNTGIAPVSSSIGTGSSVLKG